MGRGRQKHQGRRRQERAAGTKQQQQPSTPQRCWLSEHEQVVIINCFLSHFCQEAKEAEEVLDPKGEQPQYFYIGEAMEAEESVHDPALDTNLPGDVYVQDHGLLTIGDQQCEHGTEVGEQGEAKLLDGNASVAIGDRCEHGTEVGEQGEAELLNGGASVAIGDRCELGTEAGGRGRTEDDDFEGDIYRGNASVAIGDRCEHGTEVGEQGEAELLDGGASVAIGDLCELGTEVGGQGRTEDDDFEDIYRNEFRKVFLEVRQMAISMGLPPAWVDSRAPEEV